MSRVDYRSPESAQSLKWFIMQLSFLHPLHANTNSKREEEEEKRETIEEKPAKIADLSGYTREKRSSSAVTHTHSKKRKEEIVCSTQTWQWDENTCRSCDSCPFLILTTNRTNHHATPVVVWEEGKRKRDSMVSNRLATRRRLHEWREGQTDREKETAWSHNVILSHWDQQHNTLCLRVLGDSSLNQRREKGDHLLLLQPLLLLTGRIHSSEIIISWLLQV